MELTLKMPVTEDEIKTEVKKLQEQIKLRESQIDLLGRAVEHYRSFCTHPGQKTGYNERDGSWANPCPVCGESK
jgi:hypothetical protein